MSATLRSRLGFPLDQASRLPVLGEAHPLRREFARWLLISNAVAILLALLAFVAWWQWSRHRPPPPPAREIRIVQYTELGVPPPIARPAVPQVSVARAAAAAAPKLAIPQPVADELADAPTIASAAEISEALAPIALDDLGLGGGEPLVVGLDGGAGAIGSPAPGDFVDVEEEPVRIRIDPPVYPPVARDAGVSGTVLVHVLVGTDGRVKDAIVVEGHEMLREAALKSARTAVFRPALQRHRPVEVWVLVPITFRTN
ncbi:MAG: TonB family protein [bacterium]